MEFGENSKSRFQGPRTLAWGTNPLEKLWVLMSPSRAYLISPNQGFTGTYQTPKSKKAKFVHK